MHIREQINLFMKNNEQSFKWKKKYYDDGSDDGYLVMIALSYHKL
jgi:hypothetical protein